MPVHDQISVFLGDVFCEIEVVGVWLFFDVVDYQRSCFL
jgi:hypothetical protein